MAPAHADPARDMPGRLLPGRPGARVFVRRHRAASTRAGDTPAPAVLYVHGATFPSALSVGYPFDGRSWADELVAAGLDVWAFDFVGYGCADRYRQQEHDPSGVHPLGRVVGGAGRQVVNALEHVVASRGGGRVSLLAHSWGTLAAGFAAAARPDLVDRLVMFGPITRRDLPDLSDPGEGAGWRLLTAAEQYDRFVDDVPAGHPRVLTDEFDAWAADWLATDPTSLDRDPPSVRVPNGPRADILAAWSGHLAYDPARIAAATLVVRGEWDSLCTDDDARGLLAALSGASLRRDVRLPAGTHLMHLESGRSALHRAAASFLLAR